MDNRILQPAAYADLVKKMGESIPQAVSYEQRYYLHHKALGVKLRAKYRP